MDGHVAVGGDLTQDGAIGPGVKLNRGCRRAAGGVGKAATLDQETGRRAIQLQLTAGDGAGGMDEVAVEHHGSTQITIYVRQTALGGAVLDCTVVYDTQTTIVGLAQNNRLLGNIQEYAIAQNGIIDQVTDERSGIEAYAIDRLVLEHAA